jgi:hypothetical protein
MTPMKLGQVKVDIDWVDVPSFWKFWWVLEDAAAYLGERETGGMQLKKLDLVIGQAHAEHQHQKKHHEFGHSANFLSRCREGMVRIEASGLSCPPPLAALSVKIRRRAKAREACYVVFNSTSPSPLRPVGLIAMLLYLNIYHLLRRTTQHGCPPPAECRLSTVYHHLYP